MNRRVFLLTVVAVCMTVAFTAGAKELAEVEDELVALWDKVNTYAAKIEMKGEASRGAMQVSMEGKGHLEGLKKDDKSLYRMELDQTISMGENKMPNNMLVVYDGTTVWTQTNMMGQSMVLKANPEDQTQMMGVGGREAIKKMHERFDVKLLPEANVNEEPVYVLEMRPKEDTESEPNVPGKPQNFEKMVLSISQKTGLPLKMVMFAEGDSPLMTFAYKEYKLNPELDADRFAYTPPEGAMVMDAEQMRQMGGAAP